MFKRLKKTLKKIEEKATEEGREVEREPPQKVEAKTEIDEDLKKVLHDIRELIVKGGQEKVLSYFEKDVRSRAVFLTLESMAKKRRMDIEDFAEYLEDAKLKAIADEFMTEYQSHKAELQKSGFRFPEHDAKEAIEELKEAPIDSPRGDWEGKFDSLDVFGMKGGFTEKVNQIKVSITKKQAPPYEAKVEAKFEADMPMTGGSYSGSLSLPGVITAEGELRVKGTADFTFTMPSMRGGASMKVSNQVPAELIGKITRRGEAMTNKLTGTLKLKGPPEQPFKGSLPFTISKVTPR